MNELSQCTVAIVGAGYMAKEHIRAFKALPGVSIAGIFSRTTNRAESVAQEFSIPLVAQSLDELYQKTKAQLLVLAVNAEYVADMIVQSTKHPWAILAEKPVGLSYEEYTLTAQRVTEKKSQVFVAVNRRFYASTLAVLNGLKVIPDTTPRFIEVFDQQEPAKLLTMGKTAREVEKIMYANGIHLMDFFSIFSRGSIASVTPVFPWKSPAPLAVAAAVTFTSGDYGMYHAIWDAPAPWGVAVTTAEKRWELRPLEKAFYQEKGSRSRIEVPEDELDIQFKPGLYRQAQEAVKAALGKTSNSVPLSSLDNTMNIIEQIYTPA